ncbi:DUF6449 domain-containing protein [Rossellomorea vietnamensis]|uniref:DUF6449 domain-containing protein n=1 Tax=Rossellomorea vietnamensis TaxID=218284 RepID=UPI003CEEF7AB
MHLRTSWLNKEILFLIGRNTGWIGILYFAGLVFALPLNVWMRISNEESYQYLLTYGRMFRVNYALQSGMIMVVPVLLSVFLFRFLHVKQQADLIHSLPVRRGTLFLQFSAAGLSMLVLPVILTGLIMSIMTGVIDLGQHFQYEDIWKWAFTTILFISIFYVSGIAAAMLTGLSVIQAVLTYILLLFPSGIFILVVLNLKNFLFGFPEEYYMNVQSENFSPIVKAGMLDETFLTGSEAAIYIVVSVILFILAFFLYKKRNIESASQALVFPVLTPVFQFGLIFSFMLLTGAYFTAMQPDSRWTIFGYAAGFTIGFLTSEMILQKTWRVSFKIKRLIIFAAFIALAALVFQISSENYETYIPQEKEIDRVFFSGNIYSYMEEYEEPTVRYLTEKENIHIVLGLHQAILENRNSHGSERIYIIYELKTGEKVVRGYQLNRDHFDAYFESLYESLEYKKSNNEILSMEEDKADKLTITARGPHNRQVTITDEFLLKEAAQILKKEVEEESYESMVDRTDSLYDIEFLLSDDKRVYVPWKPTYTNFRNWLIEQGLYEKVQVTADDISKVLVVKRESLDSETGMELDFNQSLEILEEEGKALKIGSDLKVEELLEVTSWTLEGDYVAAFYFKGNDYPDIKGFTSANEVPEYVKNHFGR